MAAILGDASPTSSSRRLLSPTTCRLSRETAQTSPAWMSLSRSSKFDQCPCAAPITAVSSSAVGDKSAAVGRNDRLGSVVHVDLDRARLTWRLRGRFSDQQQV